jgi:ribosomal protein L7/L12
MRGLTPDQVRRLHELIHAKQLMNAVQFYQAATGASLAEAREAIEEMAGDEFTKPPAPQRDRDNPVLESKIKSLLGKNRKNDAIKIYREEYGVGLNEARAAVERIEASMMSGGISASLPYEPAIGADPFAEGNGINIRTVTLLAVALLVAACGAGVFFFLSGF